jgi:broad specificity phosphatase PhoE
MEVKLRRTRPTIWLVRHGESTWNASGLVQGQAEGPVLTARGRTQAEAVAERLQSLRIRTLVTSDLARAQETASIIGEKLRLASHSDAALRERHFGAAEGAPIDALGTDWSGVKDGRVVDAEARPPGGESIADLSQRVCDFYRRLERRALVGDVLAVTHGGVIRVTLAQCDDIPITRMPWGDVPNGGLWSVGLHEICPLVLQ